MMIGSLIQQQFGQSRNCRSGPRFPSSCFALVLLARVGAQDSRSLS